jgi:flagellar motility protein MotE (MotC chaperone)
MEQAAREAKGTFLEKVDTNSKVVIDKWEREVNTKHQGKAWVELIQEADGIRDPGATQPRKTFYQKMVEEDWCTKLMISKLRDDKNETSRVENRGHKKDLIGILSCLSNLEANARRIVEDQMNQREKMERLAGQFQLYLRYVHHMDITPADRRGTPACIRKMRTVEQKK